MKLMFIDDDYPTNFYHRIILKEYGKIDDFVIYNLPEEGLDFLLNHPETSCLPDVLFLDLNMPRLNGWELLDKLVKAGVDTPKIVILSTTTNPEHIQRAKEHPLVNGFVNKPLTLEILSNVHLGQFTFASGYDNTPL